MLHIFQGRHWIFLCASLLIFGSVTRAADLKADYQFQNSLSSTVAGAPDLTALGAGTAGFTQETVDGQSRSVYFFNDGTSASGLQAQTDGLISSSEYSIVFYARIGMITDQISKIIDFKNLDTDAGFYFVRNVPTFYDALVPVGFSPTPFPATGYGQLAFTRDSTGNVAVYLDGAPAFNFADTNGLATIDDPNSTSDFLTIFFDDPNSSILASGLSLENASGAIARLRLYDGALTADEVSNLDTVPEPTSAIAITMLGALTIRRRRPT